MDKSKNMEKDFDPKTGKHNGETQRGNTMGTTGNTRKVATKSEK
jgi:hypothetical protein